jgi:hypothetical protein
MKLDTTPNFLETNATFETTEFSIDDSPHAFELLIKRLYSDPITAIVRELVSNAWDAHVAAGTTHLPITVNAPTFMEPEFVVEDFGTGISPTRVMTHITVIFRSDRQESNDFIGGFGLGSKSPFAYSDQFNLTSRWDGIKYHYACYIGENRKPQCSFLHREPTDEPNGVTIKIPVQKDDHYKFVGAMMKILPLFPKIKTDTTLTNVECIWQSPTANVEKLNNDYSYGRLNAVIGHVKYEINPYNLFKDTPEQLKMTKYVRGNINFRFGIGELSVTPNREELIYDNKTIKTIETRILETQKTLIEDTKQAIANCATYEEACIKFTPLRLALQSCGWWDDKELIHPSRPGEPISRYITFVPDESMMIAELEYNRYGYANKLSWLVKTNIDLSQKITLLWLNPKTKRQLEYVKAYKYRKEDGTQTYLINATDINEVQKKFENYTANEITTIDLRPYVSAVKQTTRTNNPTYSVKCLFGGSKYIKDVNQFDYAVLMDGAYDAINKWGQSEIALAKKVYQSFTNESIGDLVLIPKSSWRLAKKEGWPNFIEAANETIPAMIKEHLNDLIKIRSLLKSTHATELDSWLSDNRHTELFGPLKKFRDTFTPRYIDGERGNIFCMADRYGVEIREDQGLVMELHKLYLRYQPFFTHEINLRKFPNLLIAYETYLENQQNA